MPKMRSKASSGDSYEFTELEHVSAAQTENKTAMSSDASFRLREVGQKLEAHWAEDEDMWLFLARGEHQLDIIGMNEQFFVAKGDLAHVSLYRCDAYGVV